MPPVPTRTESLDLDLPLSDDTWDYVDASGQSTGTLDAILDDTLRNGDRWRLRTIGGRRYRVEVTLGNATPDRTIGGGIDIYEGAGT